MNPDPEEFTRHCMGVESRLKSIEDLLNKMFYGLLALVAGTLGVRLTETDYAKEATWISSFLVIAAVAFLILMTIHHLWFNSKEWTTSSLWVTILVSGTMGLVMMSVLQVDTHSWVRSVARVIIAVGLGGMAWTGVLFRKKE